MKASSSSTKKVSNLNILLWLLKVKKKKKKTVNEVLITSKLEYFIKRTFIQCFGWQLESNTGMSYCTAPGTFLQITISLIIPFHSTHPQFNVHPFPQKPFIKVFSLWTPVLNCLIMALIWYWQECWTYKKCTSRHFPDTCGIFDKTKKKKKMYCHSKCCTSKSHTVKLTAYFTKIIFNALQFLACDTFENKPKYENVQIFTQVLETMLLLQLRICCVETHNVWLNECKVRTALCIWNTYPDCFMHRNRREVKNK